MCRINQSLINKSFVFLLFFSFNVSSAEHEPRSVHYAAYASFGNKLAAYTFLEEKAMIPTMNLTGRISFAGYSVAVNWEETITPALISQVGVNGDVDRSDLSINIGRRLYENFSPSFISTPYVLNIFYGYAEGKTNISYDDGVWIDYSEKGVFGGISGAMFFDKWLSSLNVSIARGVWYDTRYQRADYLGAVRGLNDISSGWSYSANYAVPIEKFGVDSDVFIGFKWNSYKTDVTKEDTGLSYIKERLIFYYLGASVYY